MKKLLTFLFLSISFLSFSKDNITFYDVPMAPFFIADGENKFKGAHDLMFNYYKNKSSYNFTTEVVSLKRLLELAKKQDEDSRFLTMILLKNPEREEFLYFSKPYDFIMSNHLIIKKESLKLFENFIDENGDFLLEEALKSDKLKLGLGMNRYYHPNINKITDNSKNIDFTVGLDDQNSIIKKLIANRINATIDYPESTRYIAKEMKVNLDFIAIPIKNVDPYNLLRFSFPKNKWGLDRVNEFNNYIDNYIKTKEFENLSLKWSPEKIKYMKKFKEEHFKN